MDEKIPEKIESCETCRFFIKAACHRYPPLLGIGSNDNSSSGGVSSVYTFPEWPGVLPEDWCGEYEK